MDRETSGEILVTKVDFGCKMMVLTITFSMFRCHHHHHQVSVELAALVGLASRLVEHLRLGAQLVRLRHQVVELLAALQYLVDGIMQDDLGLVQILLNLGHRIRLLWILVLGEVGIQLCVWNATRWWRMLLELHNNNNNNNRYLSTPFGHWSAGTLSANSSSILLESVCATRFG